MNMGMQEQLVNRLSSSTIKKEMEKRTVSTKEARRTGILTKDYFQTYEEYIEGYKQYKTEKAKVLSETK